MALFQSCPFCGGDDTKAWDVGMKFHDEEDAYAVYCGDCFARGPMGRSTAEAEVAWDTRNYTAREDC